MAPPEWHFLVLGETVSGPFGDDFRAWLRGHSAAQVEECKAIIRTTDDPEVLEVMGERLQGAARLLVLLDHIDTEDEEAEAGT